MFCAYSELKNEFSNAAHRMWAGQAHE